MVDMHARTPRIMPSSYVCSCGHIWSKHRDPGGPKQACPGTARAYCPCKDGVSVGHFDIRGQGSAVASYSMASRRLLAGLPHPLAHLIYDRRNGSDFLLTVDACSRCGSGGGEVGLWPFLVDRKGRGVYISEVAADSLVAERSTGQTHLLCVNCVETDLDLEAGSLDSAEMKRRFL